MKHGQADTITLPKAVTGAPLAIELRHLRYFVALADAGSFTHAAEQMFIAQPTLSQQIRRLEEIVGTQLLQRRREGLQLTKAGGVPRTPAPAGGRAATATGCPRGRGCLCAALGGGSCGRGPRLDGSGPRRRVLADPAAPGRCRPGLAHGP